MSTTDTEGQTPGEVIRARLQAAGVSERTFHERTGIDRKTLRRAMANEPGVRPSTLHAIETELARLETERSVTTTGNGDGLVTFELHGGGVEVILKGPVDNLAAMRAQVEELVQSLRRHELEDRNSTTTE